jgi:adenosylcobinamide-GDP ribazoletransferase
MNLPRRYLTDVMRSVAFLSRLPVADRFFTPVDATDDGRLSRSVGAFPAAGLLVALPAALVLAALLAFGTAPLLSALVALTLQTLVTGALHEDGLADTADGLGGGRSRERALEIMKDSRVGTYGVIALILTVALRAAALAALAAHLGPIGTAVVLLAVAALSRAAMAWHWSRLPPARETGVAAGAGLPTRSAAGVALASGAAVFVIALPLAGVSVASALGAALAGGVAAIRFSRYVEARIAGHTGDTIGATQHLTETTLLVALAILA